MRQLEIITNKFLTKEYLQNLFKKNRWSSFFENHNELHVANKEGGFVLHIYLNRLDVGGKEIYDDDLDPEYIEEEKRKHDFDFTPYYNLVNYFSDSYDDAVIFLYMLKKEKLTVFFKFCGEGTFEELKEQL